MTINIVSVSGQAYVSGNYVNVASIVADTYDRKGVIVWHDGFEHGLNKWDPGGSGLGNSVDITSVAAWLKDSCCMLTCGSTLQRNSDIQKQFNPYSTGNLGFEFSFATDASIDYIQLQITKFGAETRIGAVDIYKDGRLRYYKADGTWETLESGLEFTYETTHWYTVKMVLNFTDNKYVRIIHQDKTFDIDTGLRILPHTFPDYILIQVRAVGLALTNAKAYIDNFIITQDEP